MSDPIVTPDQAKTESATVVYESRKGAILGKGSGITTVEQARRVRAVLRGRRAAE